MHMEFQVFKAGTLIFTWTIKLPEAARSTQVNEFSRSAENEFRKAHPDVSLTDVDVMTRWVKSEQSFGL
ncbi:hypothetical protein GCM10007874_39730 [Labrys miyagiensis]|uniref:Uncharacterized protein n=1 Tax=Labrys miyagiensis TaxID=346912 RepID=A0ABQ6CKY2_9HYPH|nr:hypothetical protein [Labrys miyagiensis]GLS20956.1 hypothetical protein GCM10007874_39730 [Labrys miyagiensis]